MNWAASRLNLNYSITKNDKYFMYKKRETLFIKDNAKVLLLYNKRSLWTHFLLDVYNTYLLKECD